MMKIIARLINVEDGTSFYRGHGPLTELHKTNRLVHVDFAPEINFINAKGYDMAFFQRPFHPVHIKEMKTCKEMNMPIVVDYDDNYYNVPTNNNFYMLNKVTKCDVKAGIDECLELADKIIVSTEYLKKVYKHEDKTYVVNNAWDDNVFTLPCKVNMEKKVLWRGGESHSIDFAVFEDSLNKIVTDNKDFEFYFLGCPAQSLSQHKNVTTMPLMTVGRYFNVIREMKPSLVLVPLDERPFNLSKSNIAKIEATMCGALSVCPNWSEWKWDENEMNLDNEHLYNNVAEFTKQSNFLIDRFRTNDRTLQLDYEYLRDFMTFRYSLKAMNSKRYNILSGGR